MRFTFALTFTLGALVAGACGSEGSGGGAGGASSGGATSSGGSSSSGGSPAGGGTGDPSVCGATLGATCAAGTACDLGLSCASGTCACTNPPCAVACWTDRVVDHLALGGDTLFVSQRGSSAPEWQVDRIDVDGGGPKLVTSGPGAAKIATEGDRLFVAAGPLTSNNTVTRMRFDGSESSVVVPTLPPARWITATATNLLVSYNRTIALYDSAGALVRIVAGGQIQNVPRWIVVEGSVVYWVNDNVDQPKDQMYVGDLDGREPLQLGGGGGGAIGVFVACPDALYWSGSDQVFRFERGGQVDSPISRPKNGIACGSGGTIYTTGFGEFAANVQEPLAVRARAADGSSRVLYQPAQGGQAPGAIVASPAYLYWAETAGSIQRVMRMPRP